MPANWPVYDPWWGSAIARVNEGRVAREGDRHFGREAVSVHRPSLTLVATLHMAQTGSHLCNHICIWIVNHVTSDGVEQRIAFKKHRTTNHTKTQRAKKQNQQR